MIEQRVTLRYGAQQIPAIVQAVQGDTGRDVIFELADYEIPAGATANYYIDKPDDTAIYNSAEVISSTEILAHLTEQALAAPGRNNGQVRILSDGEVITSFDFVLEVEAFRGLMRMQSETEVNIFDEAIQAAAEDAIEEIQAQTPVVTGMQNSIAPIYSSSSTYAVGDYVMYNAQLYKCNTAIMTAEAWNAAHWTQVPLVNDVNDLKQDLKPMLSFKAYGAASQVISNVKVYGAGSVKYAISNINRNFNSFTGVVIYAVSGSTFTSQLTIPLSDTSGTYVALVGREAIQFDYDFSGMETGTRITVQDDTVIIRDDHYVSESSYAQISSIARIISNVRILTLSNTTYYVGYVSRNDSIAVAQVYSAKNNYAKLNNINLGIGKGSVSEYLADGAWITFDYDLTWTSTEVNYGNYVNGQTQIKSSCVTELVGQSEFDDLYASVGLFETMGVIGDSYASGWIYRTDDTSHPYRSWNQSWIQIMARDVGNTASNYSFGGMTTQSWLTHSYGKAKLESETAKQIYFLCLGINDVNALGMDYLGSGADYNNDNDTFYGNYSHIIRIIQAHAPSAKMIMFTTPFTSNLTYTAFNNAIIAIANHFEIPCIEQYKHPYIASSAFQNGLQVGHPNAVMYSGMTKAYEELIASCLIGNNEYFKNFTGSGSNS